MIKIGKKRESNREGENGSKVKGSQEGEGEGEGRREGARSLRVGRIEREGESKSNQGEVRQWWSFGKSVVQGR